ncbi:serine/threonine-protein phosphatase PP1-gamma catalytic subunit B-like isoform X1 [Varroa jacobsoni]|uniref:serine/threonine-protein phosphatase PP1-gamma catalytic subunit B-like isoform X1 n=1 Tax=Varroa jacobsoni TaxID=62625 RepID=UPI000BF85269|nr:serine/threonine-protein phosphatase PP1-gamma catalytic subunit B-like isoform X1 [Varroa jacobsoni]
MPVDMDAMLRRLLEVRRSKDPHVHMSRNEILYLIQEALPILEQQPILIELNPPLNICGDVHGNVFLLRGNHETLRINAIYGFLSECRLRYSLEVYHKFNELFAWLPLAAVVGDKIFCCHGGISPEMKSVDDIREIRRPLRDIPDWGLACDLLWADPYPGKGFAQNDRGVSYVFGADALQKFLDDNNLDLVCRAHQVVAEGYEFFANRSLVTIFSAPNYCNEFDNAASMMTVAKDLTCTFRILRPQAKLSQAIRDKTSKLL